MNKNDLKFLKAVLSVQSKSRNASRMEGFILDFVDYLGLTPNMKNGNIYVTKGKASVYPTFVAHTDTVHSIVPDDQFKVVQTGDLLYGINPVQNKWQGVGGDDKVGIFLALTLLKELPAVKVAFFADEEIGCMGSAQADMKFFRNSSFVLEADRKGNKDFVSDISGVKLYGDNFSAAIKPYLLEYGYEEFDFGGLTDVMTLKENGLRVACANVSCGYYNPHTDGEMVSISDVQNVLNLFRALAENLGYRKWKHTYQPPVRKMYRYMGDYGWSSDDRDAYRTAYYTANGYAKPGSKVSSFKSWEQGRQKDDRPNPLTVADIVNKDRELLSLGESSLEDLADEYLDGIGAVSDDETDRAMGAADDPYMFNGYDLSRGDFCPHCEAHGALDWDATWNDYFCLICQNYVLQAVADSGAYGEGVGAAEIADRMVAAGIRVG